MDLFKLKSKPSSYFLHVEVIIAKFLKFSGPLEVHILLPFWRRSCENNFSLKSIQLSLMFRRTNFLSLRGQDSIAYNWKLLSITQIRIEVYAIWGLSELRLYR